VLEVCILDLDGTVTSPRGATSVVLLSLLLKQLGITSTALGPTAVMVVESDMLKSVMKKPGTALIL
jgi:hypothetical protein